jgi:hypothetical protein
MKLNFKNTTEMHKMIQFLNHLGILVLEKKLPNDCFLSGLSISANIIYVDYNQLLYPGDLLHEAGHLAVTKSEERFLIGTKAMPEEWPTQGDEIAAMLWSYAALMHLKLPVEFVFHSDGYKGQSDWLIANYTAENYIGLPLLEWMGLTYGVEKGKMVGLKPFPEMIKWLRD